MDGATVRVTPVDLQQIPLGAYAVSVERNVDATGTDGGRAL